ncbi:uncharacterized protein TNCV_2147661 [Trichonephila clavipes]|uniref:Uncharacterized protein n=1 Tax=Trichonephila clavipes TaxID=2585209 RepID=A0A8X6T6V0_TRICX|nr:uncharacterized protein TNCV_2147661 [Trichonephila clavipes]
MEAGWSTRREARQLGGSDWVVKICWDQQIQEMSFTRRPGSGNPQQTSRQEDHHIVRNAHVQPTASSAAIHAQVASSQGALRLLEPYEGAWLKDIKDGDAHYVYCP